MSADGVYGSSDPKMARVGDHLGSEVERLGQLGIPPRLGHADHPVERDGAIETAGRRGLEGVHAAHAEPDDRDFGDVVVDDEPVGGALEVTDLHRSPRGP